MKKQKVSGRNTDNKALAKAGSAIPHKNEKLKTDEPLAEKDEIKQAEEAQRKWNKIKKK